MKVTVGIPVRNCDETLEAAIESALAQIFDDDYEIVIVDDGSTDLSAAVCLEYSFRFPEIVRFFRQNGEGVAVARNRIIQEAKGEYITWLDADDTILPFRLAHSYSTLFQEINSRGMDKVCTCADYTRNGEVMNVALHLADPIPALLCGQLNGYLWTTMIKTSVLRDIGPFRPELKRCEDLDILLRFAKAGGVFVHVGGVPQISYTFRTVGRPGKDVEDSFDYLLREYADHYERLQGFQDYAARRYWEISGFYESERKWDDMWRCRGRALTLSFEHSFPRLIATLARENKNRLDALEKKIEERFKRLESLK